MRELNIWVTIKEVNKGLTTKDNRDMEITGKVRISPSKAIKAGTTIIKEIAIEVHLRTTTNKGPTTVKGNSHPELRGIMERMIKNQEQSDKERREMNQVVSSYTMSIKKIENQLGQNSSQLNVRPRGALPSDTATNPKGNEDIGHIIAITTRSSQVLKEIIILIEDDEEEEITPPRVADPPKVDVPVVEPNVVEEIQQAPSSLQDVIDIPPKESE
ncbi:hypothetical protein A4A49_25948 [Nicotiana attenuata]|uniref:Uncharacterized protein n=1 Tax=Nicotiana attenuata TaxID=49451 RepID=A0A1J6I5I5_NICAT|nr:hypothetical protein A4A49_25948 [Nicotiana attenuata]